MDESQPNGFSLVKRPHGCDFSSKTPTKNSLDRLDEPGVSTAAPSSASAPALRVTHQARCGTIGSWGQSYSAGPLCEATGRGKHYSHPRTLKPTATQGGGTSPTPVRRYGPDRERMLIAWLMRSRSSTATLKSLGYAGFPRHAGAGSDAVRLLGRGRDTRPVPRSVSVGLKATGTRRSRSGSEFRSGLCAFCLTRICRVHSSPS